LKEEDLYLVRALGREWAPYDKHVGDRNRDGLSFMAAWEKLQGVEAYNIKHYEF
jgi:hypothetical protein